MSRLILIPLNTPYGKWVVISGPQIGPYGKIMYLCRCQCGREKLVYTSSLRLGRSTGCMSCGQMGKHSKQTDTSEFSKRFTHVPPKVRDKLRKAAWGAIDRCTNPDNLRYADWGGRGIQVWFADKVAFFEYLLTLPGHDNFSLMLDRIDNDKNYEPGNLRFVTRSVSQRNRRVAKEYRNP